MENAPLPRFWFNRRRRRTTKSKRKRRWLRYTMYALGLLLVIDAGYIVGLLPDWEHYQRGPIQKSNFIKAYESRRSADSDLPPVRWRAVPLTQISENLRRAVIVAEDARFFGHRGIDIEALNNAMQYNIEKFEWAYGGSTISQQTVKNMLLSPSRNPLRKWHELWLTLDMERHLSKRRILEIYLNVAEFGRGIYGAEAGARHYFGKTAARLTLEESIELSATLSSPTRHNPATRSRHFQRQVRKIRRHLRWSG